MPPKPLLKRSEMYRGPVGSLYHRCPLCPARPNKDSPLLRCGACRAIRYCSREHQAAHRPEHKYICKEIKVARATLAKEEHAVRNAEPDFMTPANAFESCVVDTLDGVAECLEHMQDMLRLCRSDNMGNRQIVPTIMLRLDLDQECYDFMKWWATCDPHGTYDWGDMSLPYMDLRGADVFENPDCIVSKSTNLEHLDALLVLKLKLLVDIRNIKITRKVLAKQRLPLELRDQIEQDVVRSPLSLKLQKETYDSLLESEVTLLKHIRRIGTSILRANLHFTPLLFDPDEALQGEFQMYSPGSREEASLGIQSSYATWRETEGALDLMSDASACAMRDWDDGIRDSEEFRKAREAFTSWDMGSDLSFQRMWWYMAWAVENYAWLGPFSERPSERHTKNNRKNGVKYMTEMTTLLDTDAWSDDDAPEP